MTRLTYRLQAHQGVVLCTVASTHNDAGQQDTMTAHFRRNVSASWNKSGAGDLQCHRRLVKKLPVDGNGIKFDIRLCRDLLPFDHESYKALRS